jgi:hypothetical protein
MHPMLISINRQPVFFWNVDGAVGEHGENRPEDVALVQFFYYMLPDTWVLLHKPATPLLAEVCRNVAGTMNGHCSGLPDDPLVNLIRNHQKNQTAMLVDGRVSRATPAGQYQVHGKRIRSTFMIIEMMATWRFTQSRAWPRLDLHPACPLLVKAAVQRTFGDLQR